jgi:hypothetical protein
MSLKNYAAISVLGLSASWFALAQSNAPITGQWTIASSSSPDKVHFGIQRTSPNHNMNSSSDAPLSQFRGITRAQIDSTGTVARFDLVRDAGTFHMEGYLQNGGGGGNFNFTPNPNFANELRSFGFAGDLTDEKVFAMAIHDVSGAYIRDMNALGIRADSDDKLIAMRIHGVTPEYVRGFKDLGYSELSADKLVTMRIHGVGTDFARGLKDMGYNTVATDQMVTMRIHGASLDFIKEINALGYDHPTVDQLVTMRIHGVSPEFIRKTRNLGMGNLSIDKLVSLRIHGVLE